MARTIEKLSPAKVKAAKRPGLYGDGAGLALHVGPTGSKSWVLRYMIDGKAREMGLGPLHVVGLADARKLAAKARWLIRVDGVDPLEARHAERVARRQDAARGVTFQACAAKYIAANRVGWKNAKHALQWGVSLATYAYPVIGEMSVTAIDTGDVMRVLEPIWTAKPETASRVRGRVETVLDYAKAHGWRAGENPARWRGHLQNVLPARTKVARVEHHAALPWQDVGAFLVALRSQDDITARALEFAILTAARTGEVLGACWGEVDLQAAVWTVPAARMKGGREHRVPLSDAAAGVLRDMARLRTDDSLATFVFPGPEHGKPLSSMSLFWLLRRMKRGDVTVHGFRSSFKDWAAETGQPSDVSEAALAHALGSKVQAAYQRGDLLERRRRLMDAWSAFCGRTASATGEVVELRRGVVA